jgi:Arc/MetJ-type ribon-helix-helix transcriptional regulator
MKVKLSITVDDATLRLIEEQVASQRFRNKSHAVEYAVRKLLLERLAKQKRNNENSQNNLDVIKPAITSSHILDKGREKGEING